MTPYPKSSLPCYGSLYIQKKYHLFSYYFHRYISTNKRELTCLCCMLHADSESLWQGVLARFSQLLSVTLIKYCSNLVLNNVLKILFRFKILCIGQILHTCEWCNVVKCLSLVPCPTVQQKNNKLRTFIFFTYIYLIQNTYREDVQYLCCSSLMCLWVRQKEE